MDTLNDTAFNVTFSNSTLKTCIQNVLCESHPRQPIAGWLTLSYVCLILLGILTNTTALVIMTKPTPSLMYVYLKSIAFLDLVTCISLLSGVVMLSLAVSTNYIFVFINTFILLPLFYISANGSTLVTVFVTFDRVFHTISPMRARVFVTRFKVRIIVLTAILIAVGLRCPFILFLRIDSAIIGNSTFYWTGLSSLAKGNFGKIIIIIPAVVFEYFPPVALTLSNITIVHGLNKIKKTRKMIRMSSAQKGQDLNRKQCRNEKLLALFLTISLQSIVCNIPVTILRLIWPVPSDMLLWKNLSNLLYLLDHCSNLFAFLIFDERFQEALQSVCCRPCRHTDTHNDANEDSLEAEPTTNSRY